MIPPQFRQATQIFQKTDEKIHSKTMVSDDDLSHINVIADSIRMVMSLND